MPAKVSLQHPPFGLIMDFEKRPAEVQLRGGVLHEWLLQNRIEHDKLNKLSRTSRNEHARGAVCTTTLEFLLEVVDTQGQDFSGRKKWKKEGFPKNSILFDFFRVIFKSE